MSIRIWHRRDSRFGLDGLPTDPACFDLVAEVATTDLEQAYAWSQHIDAPWHRHSTHVVHAYRVRPRSTSVGDILEVSASGACFLVGWQGFIAMPGWRFAPDQ